MAIPWLSVLKLVPWSDVIRNAPVVADGAKKLWATVRKKVAPVSAGPAVAMPNATASEPIALHTLQAQLAQTQLAVDSLHQQMLASSELIEALADQNTQLIERVEVLRKRLAWLAWSVAALVVILAVMGFGFGQ
jgi:N-acetyl-beta-hexosaminidase